MRLILIALDELQNVWKLLVQCIVIVKKLLSSSNTNNDSLLFKVIVRNFEVKIWFRSKTNERNSE